LTDPSNPKLVFPDLNAPPFGGEDFQTNLIMPEPCPFLSRKFPVCSIIRPTKTQGAAMGAVRALTADGLFIGQPAAFFELLRTQPAAAIAPGGAEIEQRRRSVRVATVVNSGFARRREL